MAKDSLDCRMEDLGVRGDERSQLLTSDMDKMKGRFDALKAEIEEDKSKAHRKRSKA